jgi:hypothetical protein
MDRSGSMGLFVLPPKPKEEMVAEDYVNTAIDSLELWRTCGCDQRNDYMITMAITYLNDAMRKLRT